MFGTYNIFSLHQKAWFQFTRSSMIWAEGSLWSSSEQGLAARPIPPPQLGPGQLGTPGTFLAPGVAHLHGDGPGHLHYQDFGEVCVYFWWQNYTQMHFTYVLIMHSSVTYHISGELGFPSFFSSCYNYWKWHRKLWWNCVTAQGVACKSC